MPEPTDEELGLDPQQMEGLDPNIRTELRRSRQLSRDLDAANVRAEQATREAAFAKAGIPDTPLGQMFGKAYDGTTDDPEAIKTAFEALGGGSASEPTEAELEEQRRLAQVGSQGQPGGDVRFEDAMRASKNADEVMDLIRAAPEGATTRSIDGIPRRIAIPTIE